MAAGPIPDGGPLRPSALVEAVLANAASAGDLAPATLTELRDVLGRFAQFMEQGLGIPDVRAAGHREVRDFIRSRRAEGSKASLSQMHNRRTACRYLFRSAMALGLLEADPTVRIELPPRRRVDPRPLTNEEIERCRAHACFHPDDLIHPVAWALAEATARTIEIARVTVGDVDPDQRIVRLPGSARSASRTASLTGWGLVQVRRRLHRGPVGPDDPLVGFRSRKVPRASASMAVIEVMRAAGLGGSGVRPMSVVAWRGALAHADGASIEQVADLLGIASLDRTAALVGNARTGSR
jgi:integrase/recombinase XerC